MGIGTFLKDVFTTGHPFPGPDGLVHHITGDVIDTVPLTALSISRETARATGLEPPSKEEFHNGIRVIPAPKVFDLNGVIQAVRTAYHESTVAKGLICRRVELAVGSGLKVEFAPDTRILGLSDKKAKKWADNAQALFDAWWDSKEVSSNKQWTGRQMQELIAVSLFRDNDLFIRFHWGEDQHSPLSFQLVDPLQVGFCPEVTTDGTDGIYDDGIVRNSKGEELKYKIWNVVNGSYKTVELPARTAEGLRVMLHAYKAVYAGQQRGISDYATALYTLSQITQLSAAELQKCINQSRINLWVKPSADAAASPALDGTGVHSRWADKRSFNEAPSYVEGDNGDVVDYEEMKDIDLGIGGIGVFSLQKGESLEGFQATSPGPNFTDFMRAFITEASQSTGQAVEVLQKQFSTSYAAGRAALLMVWETVSIDRADLKDFVMSEIVDAWLYAMVSFGVIKAPGFSDPLLRKAWSRHMLYGSNMPDIDPLNTANATKARVELGHVTLERSAADYNNSKIASNLTKLTEEISNLPIPPWSKGYGPLVTAEAKEEIASMTVKSRDNQSSDASDTDPEVDNPDSSPDNSTQEDE